MANVPFAENLRRQYQELFNAAIIREERVAAVNQLIASLLANKARYENVAGVVGIPWRGIAISLQQWLNTFPGIFVKLDGAPGERTSAAYKQVAGAYLPGDPRA